jgi:hypothetical protein
MLPAAAARHGQAGADHAQPGIANAAMRGDAQRPDQHGERRQDTSDAKALQQEIGQDAADGAGQVRGVLRRGGVQRGVARIVGGKRQQDADAADGESQGRDFGNAATHDGAQRGGCESIAALALLRPAGCGVALRGAARGRAGLGDSHRGSGGYAGSDAA